MLRRARAFQRACQTRAARIRRIPRSVQSRVVGTPTWSCQHVTAMTTHPRRQWVKLCPAPSRGILGGRGIFRRRRCVMWKGLMLAALVLVAAPAAAQDRLDAAAAALDRATAQ